MDDGSGYELTDPKSADYHDRMSDVFDNRDKLPNARKVERCVAKNGIGVPIIHHVTESHTNTGGIIVVRSGDQFWSFDNTYEFRTFLKMLMRFDERL